MIRMGGKTSQCLDVRCQSSWAAVQPDVLEPLTVPFVINCPTPDNSSWLEDERMNVTALRFFNPLFLYFYFLIPVIMEHVKEVEKGGIEVNLEE